MVIPKLKVSVKKRTSDDLSVYMMLAIVTALQWIEELRIQKVILCSNFRSALLSLQSFTSSSRQDTVNEVYESLY